MNTYRIILADDHALFRQGIRRIIEEAPDLEVVAEVQDGLALLKQLNRTVPDLIVMDIAMPRMRGLEAAKEVKARFPGIKILLLTMHRDPAYFKHASATGVEGYLLKEDADSELFSAIRALRSGRTYVSPILLEDLKEHLFHFATQQQERHEDPLTARERQIVKLIAEGRTSRQIGQLLHISPRTVDNHRANAMKKIKARRAADLVRHAVHHRYVEP